MQLFAHDLRCFAFLRADSFADYLTPGIMGDGLLVREGAPFEPADRWSGISRVGRRQLARVGQQPRFSKARFTHDRNERATSLADLFQLVVDELEFGVTAYQRRGQPLQTSHLARYGFG